ncbi:AAA-like domain-containing protein [Pannus brasiliensis CCIBt3594]|uniref:AAA-like domain-containing protein n=1 Tax=Pannus brasiliensis CCIBt3594 TaxID=1427578 RepID=A0AAW9QX90_9CHRO
MNTEESIERASSWIYAMQSESVFTWEIARTIADRVVFQRYGEYLKDTELAVLEESWKGTTYEQMAENLYLSVNYLRGDVGPKLWSKLSKALGEEVTKNNFKAALRRAGESSGQPGPPDPPPAPPDDYPPYPGDPIPLESPYYIEREGVETIAYEAIGKPGALVRVKAPNLTGKTSLLLRILARGEAEDYRTAYINLRDVERSKLANLDMFLRWFCVTVGNRLGLKNRCPEMWDTDILGSNDNCTLYFEEYLLKALDCPLVLGIDNVDRVFPYSEVVEDFFGMLRSWHEKGKIRPSWKQLRLVLVHSTECYVPLDLNQSPFNAGIPIALGEFDRSRLRTLVSFYRLPWNEEAIDAVTAMVGTRPYLLALAFHAIGTGKITLERLLREAPTEVSIYSDHLRRQLEILQQAPELARAFYRVVASAEPIELSPMQTYKLHSMGLIQQEDNRVRPGCRLYREYFERVLALSFREGLAE